MASKASLNGSYNESATDKSEQDAVACPQSNMKVVLVVAAALIDTQGRVLLAQRPEGKPMAGLWEFPGGKVEAGETPEFALCRELVEELNVQVQMEDLVPVTFASHSYEKFHLLMPVFACYKWRGAPAGMEEQSLKWVDANDLSQYPMPPADIPLLDAIQLVVQSRPLI